MVAVDRGAGLGAGVGVRLYPYHSRLKRAILAAYERGTLWGDQVEYFLARLGLVHA